MFGFLGPNDAGKTSPIWLLLGVLAPTSVPAKGFVSISTHRANLAGSRGWPLQ